MSFSCAARTRLGWKKRGLWGDGLKHTRPKVRLFQGESSWVTYRLIKTTTSPRSNYCGENDVFCESLRQKSNQTATTLLLHVWTEGNNDWNKTSTVCTRRGKQRVNPLILNVTGSWGASCRMWDERRENSRKQEQEDVARCCNSWRPKCSHQHARKPLAASFYSQHLRILFRSACMFN